MPRLAVINAAGADTLYELVRAPRPALERRPARHGRSSTATTTRWTTSGRRASTIASAIEINRPVNLTKCLRALEWMRRRRPRGQRPGDPRRQGPGRRRRPGLRAGQRRQRRRRRSCSSPKASSRPTSASSASSPATSSRTPRPRSPTTRTDQEQFDEVLGSRGVRRAAFANRAVAVPNDLDEIIKAIRLYSSEPSDDRTDCSSYPLSRHATSHCHSRRRRTHGPAAGRPGRRRSPN